MPTKTKSKVAKVEKEQESKLIEKEVVSSLKMHDRDTGSSQFQVALLTEKINALEAHFKAHHKDKHSRTGLLKMIGKRRKHLQYLKNNDEAAYKAVLEKLNLRK